ncbi:PTS fructose transporter subunit IIC [Clostridium estertheticum]|uniref:PTS fructose transporter subunit IIBC n=1 Tax=Clostridium estertheticum TaxID=238834 RepID=A0A5N7IVP2_9CLOT|nr:fructose-specific PTS transporter subunit EIIC [Clostridium estertheticum]MBU3075988.1 fructose-specific PTS transporter subunit EIIC [Clostridium estertheticum]MBU3166108.1 fructose-specific PTS transporter subunit EIIC [Clostridium estertheticum]MBU3187763.1 fructose-specific PTS transporter subunit EIIC [Clostridium estertheticum]MCB2343202.1 fructose-specific PTS transporter subunit EIIC [Clostridium estertheticum]MPQ29866.1 PTS fructose transporter subunit IIBC [Clostridium esterthetic
MKFVAITSCPTGIAHTYMAAEALSMAGEELGIEIKVETQGSVGAENQLTEADIREARVVIIAADTNVSKERFEGKTIIEVGVKDAIKDAKGLIQKAIDIKLEDKNTSKQGSEKKEEKVERKGVYKHLMTGVSYMIPFVAAGGILIALSFAFGIYAFKVPGSIAEALKNIGGGNAMALMYPVLAGFIAFSIADRPGLVPGMVGGMLAATVGAAFLGAMAAGFVAGYTVLFLKKAIKLPKSLQGLMPVIILPVLSTMVVGLVMIYVIGKPVSALTVVMSKYLTNLNGANAGLLGIILGLMMAFDMGGPFNKAAYTFGVSTLALAPSSAIMAAVMAAGMTPPLGIALATVLAKKKFTAEERESGKSAWALGAAFITEGAIPFAVADPLRIIPSTMAGAAVTGALSMIFKASIVAPHGGIFLLFIPHAVTNLGGYIIAILAGTIVTGVMVSILKKDVVLKKVS